MLVNEADRLKERDLRESLSLQMSEKKVDKIEDRRNHGSFDHTDSTSTTNQNQNQTQNNYNNQNQTSNNTANSGGQNPGGSGSGFQPPPPIRGNRLGLSADSVGHGLLMSNSNSRGGGGGGMNSRPVSAVTRTPLISLITVHRMYRT